jgi:hypothetical protein
MLSYSGFIFIVNLSYAMSLTDPSYAYFANIGRANKSEYLLDAVFGLDGLNVKKGAWFIMRLGRNL